MSKITEIVNIPEGVKPFCIINLGYPAECWKTNLLTNMMKKESSMKLIKFMYSKPL